MNNDILTSYSFVDCKKTNVAFCVDCASPIPLTLAMRAPGSSYLLRVSWSAHPAARSAKPNVGSIDPFLIQSIGWKHARDGPLHVEHMPYHTVMHHQRKELLCKVHPEVWWADALNSRIHPDFRMCSELLTVEGMNTEALQHQTIRQVWVFSWTWTENHGCMYFSFLINSQALQASLNQKTSQEMDRWTHFFLSAVRW